ncbi:MAG: hypothetical protein AAGF77_06635 [Bacteroidota bacterium]
MAIQKNGTGALRLQKVLVISFLFMVLGTALELYLLNHYEGVQQLIPLFCIGVAVFVFLLLFFRETKVLKNLFLLILGLTALSGIYGTFLHLRANYEFEMEMKPTATPRDLFLESISGALPALAPCSMIVLSLIGYSYLLVLNYKR